MSFKLSRRNFLGRAAAAGTAALLPSTAVGMANAVEKKTAANPISSAIGLAAVFFSTALAIPTAVDGSKAAVPAAAARPRKFLRLNLKLITTSCASELRNRVSTENCQDELSPTLPELVLVLPSITLNPPMGA